MNYQPTPAGQPRPAPPKPDTPNTGVQHTHMDSGPASPPASQRRLQLIVEVAILGWIAFDVSLRIF